LIYLDHEQTPRAFASLEVRWYYRFWAELVHCFW